MFLFFSYSGPEKQNRFLWERNTLGGVPTGVCVQGFLQLGTCRFLRRFLQLCSFLAKLQASYRATGPPVGLGISLLGRGGGGN